MNNFGLPTEIIKSAKMILENKQEELPIIGMLKSAIDSGRYHITGHEESDNYHDFDVHAVRPAHAVEFTHRKGYGSRKPIVGWYDPHIATPHTPHPEDDFPRTYPTIRNSNYHDRIQEQPTPGVIYRGMSQEEYDDIQRKGYIQSKGAFNMDGQEGLTYYSRDPSQAQSYAHSFAPPEHKATGQHKAYVVAVQDPGTDVKIQGTGENEVGIPHAISNDKILHVWEGTAYSGMPGKYSVHKSYAGPEEGSSSNPQVSIAWRKL